MKHFEVANNYDGYDDYFDAVTFDYQGDLDEDDYEEEFDVPEYMRV